VTFVRI